MYTPKQIVEQLNKHIIGQEKAKKLVAIALRNRWRRQQLSENLQQEITPKNILMIGPTGVGKTEIARRLAKLTSAPFIKIEATKFTEIGYVGKDVESIVRDLASYGVQIAKDNAVKKILSQAEDIAEEKILDILVSPKKKSEENDSKARQLMRKKLREGKLDNKIIEIVDYQKKVNLEIIAPPGMDDIIGQLQDSFAGNKKVSTKKQMLVKKALKYYVDQTCDDLLDFDEITEQAINDVEQKGIVFLDEIDKIINNENDKNGISREGVQRDLLPIIEGTVVNTKYGQIKTDHILFIASGSFHLSKPSDLIPELQGRLPVRVEMTQLSKNDFIKILTETENSLISQYQELIKTEGLNLKFSIEAIKTIANLTYQINQEIENIGARRLYTVMEKILEDISFEAKDIAEKGSKFQITAEYVNQKLDNLIANQDLTSYIL